MPAFSGWSSGMRAPAHQRRDDRHPGQLGELDQQVGRVGVDDAAAGDDQRALGGRQHVERLLDLGAGRGRLVHRQRLVGLEVELDLGQLDVDRQVDQHRARAARSASGGTPAGTSPGTCAASSTVTAILVTRLGDRGDVDGLEVLLVQLGDRRLAGDAQDRDRVGRWPSRGR